MKQATTILHPFKIQKNTVTLSSTIHHCSEKDKELSHRKVKAAWDQQSIEECQACYCNVLRDGLVQLSLPRNRATFNHHRQAHETSCGKKKHIQLSNLITLLKKPDDWRSDSPDASVLLPGQTQAHVSSVKAIADDLRGLTSSEKWVSCLRHGWSLKPWISILKWSIEWLGWFGNKVSLVPNHQAKPLAENSCSKKPQTYCQNNRARSDQVLRHPPQDISLGSRPVERAMGSLHPNSRRFATKCLPPAASLNANEALQA